MKTEMLDSIAGELFTIPPLIGRSVRRKLLKMAMSHIREDISPLQFEIMRTLEEAGRLHVTEIGDRLQIPRPQMTRLIDKLVALDMVKRQPSARDRRIINIALTSRGKTLLKKHRRMIEDAIKNSLASLTDGELEELSISLRKLRQLLSKLE